MRCCAQAAAALANVCASSTEIQAAIAGAGAVAPLVAMLEVENEVLIAPTNHERSYHPYILIYHPNLSSVNSNEN